MLQIDDKILSLDIIEEFFVCDLDRCKGECCIEGDAGAPITPEEYETICGLIPLVWDRLSPAAQKVLEEKGPGYYDEEGDLVTSIVGGRDCVFTTYAPGGKCLCALEQVCREGKSTFCKPLSCELYPIRVTHYSGFDALNLHKWKICSCARKKGKKEGVRVYEFLRAPLVRAYGEEFYKKLEFTARQYLASKNKDKNPDD